MPSTDFIKFYIKFTRVIFMFSVFFASDRSSSGKSMVTLAFSKKIKELGYEIDVFKSGPDFVDPIVISNAVNTEVKNLDPFLIPSRFLNSIVFNPGGHGGDANRAFIVEGAMGLYDGNSYSIVKKFKFPVILVMDSKRISSTMASLIFGLKKYKKGVNICGVILNNISSARHYEIISEEIKHNIKGMEVFGYILNNKAGFGIKERHLGLVTPISSDCKQNQDRFETVADNIKNEVFRNIDLNLMIKTLERESGKFNNLFFDHTNRIKHKQSKLNSNKSGNVLHVRKKSKRRIKIAVAYDNAFFFYYNFNIEILKSFGAEIVFFSPLSDKTIPKGVNMIYIGGGYPEIYAKDLAKNRVMLNEIYKFFKNNGIIYAECGGLMYLCRGLVYKGKHWKLSEILPFDVTMDNARLSLGYRTVHLKERSFLGDAGLKVKGHEFHYSGIIMENVYENDIGKDLNTFKSVFEYESPSSPGILKKEGYNVLNAVGSYIHLSFLSNKLIVKNIIDSAMKI